MKGNAFDNTPGSRVSEMKKTSRGKSERWLGISARTAHEIQTGFFSVAESIISHFSSYLEYPL